MDKIKSGIVIAALTIAAMVVPSVANASTVNTAPVSQSVVTKASYCPWWVANGYWRVIWYWGTGQCR